MRQDAQCLPRELRNAKQNMALEANAAGDFPKVAQGAFVHETATLIGPVEIAQGVFVGPQAVLRADEPGADGKVQPIVVEENANIQDGVIVHALGGTGVRIGARSSVAHGAIVHGPCRIGKDCFIGFGSVVFKAELGDGVIVMHSALIEGVTIPSGRFVPSMMPVRCEADVGALAIVSEELAAFARRVSQTNNYLVQRALEMRATTCAGAQKSPKTL